MMLAALVWADSSDIQKMTMGWNILRNNCFANLITSKQPSQNTYEWEWSVYINQDFIIHLRNWHTVVHWTNLPWHLLLYSLWPKDGFPLLNDWEFFFQKNDNISCTWKLYEFQISRSINVKLYWNTATLTILFAICLLLSSYFYVTTVSWIIVTETVWSTKPKILTV